VDSTLSNAVDGPGLLFGQAKQIELTEILATLPPKTEVDKLISQFFDYKTFPIMVARKLRQLVFRNNHKLTKLTAILHEPTFMHEVLILPEFYHTIILIS
jgi:hypothetical protein